MARCGKEVRAVSVNPPVRKRMRREYGYFLPAKVLGQLQALGLVIRTDAPAIEGIGPRQHVFVDQATDDLTVLDNEWHLVGTHLQHRAGATPAGAGITEPWIEEARVMYAKFADQRIERNHFGGIIGRHLDGFLGRQDV